MSKHNNFPIALLRDLNDISKVADAAINLDLVVEEFLELTDIEDFVAGRTGSIDYELSRSIIIIPQGGRIGKVRNYLMRNLSRLRSFCGFL